MKTLRYCVVPFVSAALCAQDSTPIAKLVDAISPSIVTVRVVAEMSGAMMGGETHEMKQEAIGVIVDKSGLVLVPTSATDPLAHMSMMFGGEAEVESNVTSLKVVLGNDPKELTATVVAKDDKLGFTFVKITDLGDRQLVPLAFEQKAEPAVGVTVWTVGRLPEGYDFAPIARRSEVVGRVKKPRSAWALAESLETGSPVFTAEGALCGVVAQVQASGDQQDGETMMMRMLGGGMRGPTAFIVNSQVAANAVTQAIEAASKAPAKAEGAKEGEKKDEPKKEGEPK